MQSLPNTEQKTKFQRVENTEFRFDQYRVDGTFLAIISPKKLQIPHLHDDL